jgi:hypothetical protein
VLLKDRHPEGDRVDGAVAILRAASVFPAVSAAKEIAFTCDKLPCHLQNGVLQ